MIKNDGINISSKNPEVLAKFYNEKLGIPFLTKNASKHDYDRVKLGFNTKNPLFCIWNENNWGKLYFGEVMFVFRCENLDIKYHELNERGVILDPPSTAVWGGKELYIKDPDNNNIVIIEDI